MTDPKPLTKQEVERALRAATKYISFFEPEGGMIQRLCADWLRMEVENERLWHALSQTYALLPPERVKLANGAKWMFENHEDSYKRVREKD